MPRSRLVIHSGGQTGVDRAALDAALAAGVPVGGWCPRGRGAEDGPIPRRYPLRERSSEDVAERTAWNVRDTDATLVLTSGEPDAGTALTMERAQVEGKPLLVLDITGEPDIQGVAGWVRAHGLDVLNVAGPRESNAPGIYAEALALLSALFRTLGY